MRPLILKMEMSIDGFVGQPDEKPGWPVDFYDDELSALMLDLIGGVGVHAMGRVAYEEMAPYWQASTEPDERHPESGVLENDHRGDLARVDDLP
jgi:hypothetical protein